MSEDPTMRECLMRDIHNLEDQRDFAMGVIKRLERERNDARVAFTIATVNCTEAQQRLRDMEDQRDFAMDVAKRLERERDEARLQYRSTEALAMALVKTIGQMKDERVDLKLKIQALRDGGWANI